jgi:ADP-heptose:LPS heptosyltransferase
VLGYPRYPKGPKWYQDFGRVRTLRRERYDAVLNLNGSDRSSLLTFLTGAPFRLGRRPRGGGPPHWKYLFTHICDAPRGHMLHYRQNLAALQAAGFSLGDPEFHTVIPDSVNRSISDKLEGKTDFIHVSPFTNDDYKELPSGQLAEVLNQLNLSHPQSRVVLSCAPTPRERRKLETLRQQLQFQPWKYFEGTLSLPEFAALMGQCRLHLGGDSGALHVALLMGTPTVSWFRRYADINEWRPDGDPHQSVLGEASDQGLQGISSESILALLKQSLEPHL